MEENLDNKPKPTMYHLITDRIAMQEIIEEYDGELPPHIADMFHINETDLQAKASNMLDWLEQINAFLEMGKNKVKQAQEFIKKQERLKARIEGSLLQAATVYGSIKCDTRTVSTRKSESVEISDVDEVPELYVKTQVVRTADKNAIKAEIKRGFEVPGAELITKTNLSIK